MNTAQPNASIRTRRIHINWRPPFITAVLAGVVFLALVISPYGDLLLVTYWLVVAPVVTLVLLVLAIAKRNLTIACAVLVYATISFAQFKLPSEVAYPVREFGRWFLLSRSYKPTVLSQPDPGSNELRHVEWDGWGFAGNENVVYIVYDPDDSLTKSSQTNQRYSSSLCDVWKIVRLERNWYSVAFYTNEGWGDCGQ